MFVVSCFVHYNSLLQNAADIITNWDTYFITKRDKSLLQSALAFFNKTRQFYYKMRKFLQIATFLKPNSKNLAKSHRKNHISLNILKQNKKN